MDPGPQHRDHLLEQYKLYVEMTDRVSHRRALANSFFLTLQTGLLGLATGLTAFSPGRSESEIAGLIAAIFGLVFSYVWWRTLKSYRQLNTAKFAVIHDLEAQLPAAPYDLEWDKAGRGRQPAVYLQLTVVEGRVPILFALGYLTVAVLGVIILLWDVKL